MFRLMILRKHIVPTTVLLIVLIIAGFSSTSTAESDADKPKLLDTSGNTNFRYILLSGTDPADTHVFRKDKDELAELIRNKVPEENRKELLDLDGSSIGNQSLRYYIEGVRDRAQPCETVVFYYSGHGSGGSINWKIGNVTHSVSPFDLMNWLTGIRPSVKIALILDACEAGSLSHQFLKSTPALKDSEGNNVPSSHKRVIAPKKEVPYVRDSGVTRLLSWLGLGRIGSIITSKILNSSENMDADINKDNKIDIDELFNQIKPAIECEDKDRNGMKNQDPVEHEEYSNGTIIHLFIDNDNNGYADEDAPVELASPKAEGGIGGIAILPDKFGLLAPYIGLASAFAVAPVAVAIHVRRARRGNKEKRTRTP